MKKRVNGLIIFLVTFFVVTDGIIGYSGYGEYSANITPFLITILTVISFVTIGMLTFVYIIVMNIDNAVITEDEYRSIQNINNNLDNSNKFYFYFRQIVYILLTFLLAINGFLYSAFTLLTLTIFVGASRVAVKSIRNHTIQIENNFVEQQLQQVNDNN